MSTPGVITTDREVPADLRRQYLREGLWTDDTLGGLLDAGLASAPGTSVRIWSHERPFRGRFRDLRELGARLAGGLAARGVRPGDCVAFQLPNWIEAATCFAGLAAAGVVLVPIPPYYSARELRQIVSYSGARMLVMSGSDAERTTMLVDEVRAAAPTLEHVVVVGPNPPSGCESFDDLLAGSPAAPARPDPDSTAMVAFTSGTGSTPKGVVHTHRSMCAEVRLHLPILVRAGARPQLMGSPISHAAGMVLGLLLPIHRGEPINFIDVWDPGAVFAAMTEDGLAAGSGAVVFLGSLLDSPDLTPALLAQMDAAVLGASAVPTAFAARARAAGIEVVRSYGLTEQPTVSGASVADPGAKRESTDGRALPGVDVRIVGPDGGDLGVGEPGEVLTRGPDLMAGYTDAALNAELIDADGWLKTGDVGILDADGWLAITGRVKDVIIRHGLNINPAEVENLLLGMPQVLEAAVVGRPDDRTGERACAVVRLRAGSTIELSDLRDHLQGVGLARPKWPEEVQVIDDFPRTASGKIQKFALRAALDAR